MTPMTVGVAARTFARKSGHDVDQQLGRDVGQQADDAERDDVAGDPAEERGAGAGAPGLGHGAMMPPMTPGILVFVAFRVATALPVLRWPLAGGLLAIAGDLADLLVRDLLGLGASVEYQVLDKLLDQVYLALFLVVALRWDGVERRVAVALYRLPSRGCDPLPGHRRTRRRCSSSRTSSSRGSSSWPPSTTCPSRCAGRLHASPPPSPR